VNGVDTLESNSAKNSLRNSAVVDVAAAVVGD